MTASSHSRVFTRRRIRELDRRAIEDYGLPGIILMENASRGVAEYALRMLGARAGRHVLLVCGGGNNGGDGLAAARHLHNAGIRVTILLMRPPGDYQGDAAMNLRICREMKLKMIEAADDPLAALRTEPPADLVVDALLGTGLSSEVRQPLRGVIDWMNEGQHAPVLAVDIPSGLECDTGIPLGAAVRAAATVTFVGPKRGFLFDGARPYTGEVHVADIGAPRELVEQLGEKVGTTDEPK